MSIRTSELFNTDSAFFDELFRECAHPWEIIPKIRDYVTDIVTRGIDGYVRLYDDVLVGQGVTIHESAVIIGPAVIGHGTEIRPHVYIRGSVIVGNDCVIGNSTELKNCVLLDGAQVPHYNYVGDSILGRGSHLGAGAVCSNLKSDKSNVTIKFTDKIDTGLRKLGALVGDAAEIGCGCVLNPGTVIGKNTTVYPLTATRGVYPADSIVKDRDTVCKRVDKE